MDNFDFTEEEIEEQLALLGYKNIPKHRLSAFKKDLDDLIGHRDSKRPTLLSHISHTKSTVDTSPPNPPAYTKEKVSPFYIGDYGEGFFLHTRETGQVLTAGQNRGCGRQQVCGLDSYAQHSVRPKLPLPSGAPSRLRVDPNPDDTHQSPPTHTYISSPDSQRRPLIKRKVLRKYNGQPLVCDESVYSEDSGAASCLEERLEELRLSTSAQHDSDTESDAVTSQSDAQSSGTEELNAFESYIRGMTRTDVGNRLKPKSFIRPTMSQQTMKKTDPVARYFQYKQLWEMFKVPGEQDRRTLRLEIKERLAYQPPPPRPRRVYVPNTYVVPTEKKRSALRWEIRNDLANGLIPYKFTY